MRVACVIWLDLCSVVWSVCCVVCIGVRCGWLRDVVNHGMEFMFFVINIIGEIGTFLLCSVLTAGFFGISYDPGCTCAQEMVSWRKHHPENHKQNSGNV